MDKKDVRRNWTFVEGLAIGWLSSLVVIIMFVPGLSTPGRGPREIATVVLIIGPLSFIAMLMCAVRMGRRS